MKPHRGDISDPDQVDDRESYNFSSREVYCPKCGLVGITDKRAPICKFCKCDLITKVHPTLTEEQRKSRG